MSTPTRSILSASIGPGLTLFTAISAYVNGPLAAITTIAFGLTVVWGIIEIAILTYTPISSIELDGPSLLEMPEENSAEADDKLVAFDGAHTPDARRAA